jgi:conjugative element/phage-associated large polyvalent protein
VWDNFAMKASAFIEKQKALYNSLKKKPIHCPALDTEVHFTADGLNHLLYNRRRPRSRAEQRYRAGLIPAISQIVENAKIAVKQIKSTDPLIVTWALQCEVKLDGKIQLIKIILKQEGKGKIKFCSAMRKRFVAIKKT